MNPIKKGAQQTQPDGANSALEGGVFYPVGYLVAGLANAADASRLQKEFFAEGLRPNECVVAQAETVAAEAERELADQGVIAGLGSSGHVRKRQLQLAQEGCTFLMVKADDDEQLAAAMRKLEQVPVRYAVLYRRLVIEDLIDQVDSATPDSANARSS
jgi:hypothetical protein